MSKILQATSRVIKPLLKGNLGDSVASAWAQYKKGNYATSDELMKKYGL